MMARGELLRKLIVSHRRGDDASFRAAALEIISDEESRKNHRLARDLLRLLESNGIEDLDLNSIQNHIQTLPKDRERETLLVEIRSPERRFNDILLVADATSTLERILAENRNGELLRMHGLRPASKLLFCGPPGCGKTLCAEIIAAELGLPLLYARFDSIVSSYLGETAANLRKVFDYAANGPWVVLFDEFDAIGKARDDETEHGELKRVINTFLQLLDSFLSQSILIAATNHEKLLDRALWRRFDEVLFFPLPSVPEIYSLLSTKLKNFPLVGADLRKIAAQLTGMSHADVERICLDSIKATILAGRDAVDQATLNWAVHQHKGRLKISTPKATRRTK